MYHDNEKEFTDSDYGWAIGIGLGIFIACAIVIGAVLLSYKIWP